MLMCCGYRIACTILNCKQKQGIILLQTLDHMLSPDRHPLEVKRNQWLAKLTLDQLMLGFCSIAVSCFVFYGGLAVLNVMQSPTPDAAAAWLAWMLLDFLVTIGFALDISAFPVIWLLIAYNLRSDMRRLISDLASWSSSSFADRESEDSHDARHWDSMMKRRLLPLMCQAADVDQMSAPILFVMMLGNAPVICSVLFVMQFSNRFMAMVLSVPLATFTLFAIILLSIAASVTNVSVQLHSVLLSIAAREGIIASHDGATDQGNERRLHLTTYQRLQLLILMEHLASDEQPMALHTMHGAVFSSESLMHHVLEISTHYLLLVNLSIFLISK